MFGVRTTKHGDAVTVFSCSSVNTPPDHSECTYHKGCAFRITNEIDCWAFKKKTTTTITMIIIINNNNNSNNNTDNNNDWYTTDLEAFTDC